ncbi:hypothetical protein C8F04DRAFT_1233203 [Mycena alexandri]|uniref:Uncharacterized protein n=1 Tax=Mycena alexandri TaxID=1745969 RepID=A0AAD6T0M0_9AGAR|nr:hypothetical protein C8F04DRAFT_1233203 [Mycena alexandri]
MPLFTNIGPPLTVRVHICLNLNYTSCTRFTRPNRPPQVPITRPLSAVRPIDLDVGDHGQISTKFHGVYILILLHRILEFGRGDYRQIDTIQVLDVCESRSIVEFKFNDLCNQGLTFARQIPFQCFQKCRNSVRTTETIVNLSRSRSKDGFKFNMPEGLNVRSTKVGFIHAYYSASAWIVHPLGRASPTGYMPSTIPPAKFQSGNLSKSMKQMNRILAYVHAKFGVSALARIQRVPQRACDRPHVAFRGTAGTHLHVDSVRIEVEMGMESDGGGDGDELSADVLARAGSACTQRRAREGWVGSAAYFMEVKRRRAMSVRLCSEGREKRWSSCRPCFARRGVHLLVALVVWRARERVLRGSIFAVDADDDVGMGSALRDGAGAEAEDEDGSVAVTAVAEERVNRRVRLHDLRTGTSESCIQVPTLLSKHK